VDEKSNEIPAVRDLLKAFASLASAVITIDAMHAQSDTTQVILGREIKLHWVRDVTYQEDKSLVRTGNAPRVMASLRSLAISLAPPGGPCQHRRANRHHARDPQRTLKLLQTV
jgi:predicted transposase YbfD/YdcC